VTPKRGYRQAGETGGPGGDEKKRDKGRKTRGAVSITDRPSKNTTVKKRRKNLVNSNLPAKAPKLLRGTETPTRKGAPAGQKRKNGKVSRHAPSRGPAAGEVRN